MACSVFGEIGAVEIIGDTLARSVYGRAVTREPYRCHYSLNPDYREMMLSHGLVVSGMDGDGEIRIIERRDHPFFLATLFVPQLSEEQPHPLITGLLRTAHELKEGKA